MTLYFRKLIEYVHPYFFLDKTYYQRKSKHNCCITVCTIIPILQCLVRDSLLIQDKSKTKSFFSIQKSCSEISIHIFKLGQKSFFPQTIAVVIT